MTTFAEAVTKKNNKNVLTRTENGMKARSTTNDTLVDLFYKIGSYRGKDITPVFRKALDESRELSGRLALWARDIRGGAGERQTFKNILKYLEFNDQELLKAMLPLVPEVGRWDDLLVLDSVVFKPLVFEMIKNALLVDQNGLCAKWMPRQGLKAIELRNFLGLTPKQYRKLLVGLTNVVETKICSKEWSTINFAHVPSVAHSRYKRAFNKNAKEEYTSYLSSLVKGETKINASSIFPHDVLGNVQACANTNNSNVKTTILEQWKALPNFVGDKKGLALIDVSGSMEDPYISEKIRPLDISVALGLYIAEKNTGVFKNTYLNFSGSPKLNRCSGNVFEKIKNILRSEWGMNTNLHAALDVILETATKEKVPQSEMPEYLIILSDMQFDRCVEYDDNALQMIKRKYKDAGYNVPSVVFWNLNSHNNVPAKFNSKGVALLSGYSPAILKSVFSIDFSKFTPENIMLDAIMSDRYNFSLN